MTVPAENVTRLNTSTVPREEYEALHREHEAMAGELAATRTALAREHRAYTRLKAQLEEILAPDTDKDESQPKALPQREQDIAKFLKWWCAATGRDPATTRIDLDTSRAKLVRKEVTRKPVESRRTFQELCWMTRGLMADPFFVEKGLTDLRHMLKDEQRAERFLQMGKPKEQT